MSDYKTTTITLGLATGAVSGNSSPMTVTINSADYASATRWIAEALQGGGINADNGTFFPSSSILNTAVTSYT